MTAYVWDASVAAKWVLPLQGESLSSEAVRLLDRDACGGVHFRVPDLFWPGIGNVLWKSVRLGRMAEVAAYESAESGHAHFAHEAPRGEAVRLAMVAGRTVSDAVYLALAMESGLTLLTADERFANAMGARFPVRWLGALA